VAIAVGDGGATPDQEDTRAWTTLKAVAGAIALAVPIAVVPASSAAAAPAKSEWVRGHTDQGNPVEFLLRNGKRFSRLKTTVPATCMWGPGLTQSGVESYMPPGTFRVGRTRSVEAFQSSLFTSAEITKNYRVTLERQGPGVIKGQLHVSFSVLKPTYSTGSGWHLVPAACQGDDSITVHLG
jgi:hypothetical protein